jgi:hypothetical protein
MTKEDKECLNMSNSQLRKKIAEKHSLIKDKFDSGFGLTLQYEDSKVAERVMLLLLKQDIACLPIHDSFIVQATKRTRVIAAMSQAYKERFGVEIDLKSTFLFDNDEAGERKHSVEFPIPFDSLGNVDQRALFRLHEDSIHNQYCNSWRANSQKGQ